MRSDEFIVTIDGHRTPVVHAASSYYLLNFDVNGPATVAVRAADAHYWDRGVEIQPMRYGIRPVRRGATITFRIPGPVKLSVARPGDHFADAEMLFLLGSEPDKSRVTARTAGVRYYGPGVHHQDIEAQSGDRIYLAPGAVVFGSLNFWQVHDVRVFGRGMVIYDGPQDPLDDSGWRHVPAWHCMAMDHAQRVEVDGITCVTRSRTWQVQMTDSHGIGFYNVNVIGGEAHDANQDGLDWIGSGDTTVRNCFIRASDDDFAIQGNWDGYTEEAMRAPGADVVEYHDRRFGGVDEHLEHAARWAGRRRRFASAHVTLQESGRDPFRIWRMRGAVWVCGDVVGCGRARVPHGLSIRGYSARGFLLARAAADGESAGRARGGVPEYCGDGWGGDGAVGGVGAGERSGVRWCALGG